MRQNHPNTDIRSSWSPEEVEELRRSLQISDVADDLAPFSYPLGIRVSAWVMPSRAVVAAIRGAEPSVERSVADRRAAA